MSIPERMKIYGVRANDEAFLECRFRLLSLDRVCFYRVWKNDDGGFAVGKYDGDDD